MSAVVEGTQRENEIFVVRRFRSIWPPRSETAVDECSFTRTFMNEIVENTPPKKFWIIHITRPPSIRMAWPVIYELSGLERKRTREATSDAEPRRFNAVFERTSSIVL